jgi:hypothetical protein
VKRGRSRRASRMAAEMAVIVFSVLFALAANEWRQAQSLDSAWETAQITQAAVHMDPGIVAALARNRQLHRILDGTVDSLVDILYATTNGGDIISALRDLIMFEQNLLEAYDGMLAALPPGPGS